MRVSVSVRCSAQYVAGFRRTRITTVDDRNDFQFGAAQDLDNCGENHYICLSEWLCF